MTTTLKLGVLEFAADADSDGKSVRVVIRGAIDTDVHFMTVDEWQSLCDLAAERRHHEGHTWALQAQLDDVAEALGKKRLEASDGYHGTAVRELLAEHAKDRPPWFQFNADEIDEARDRAAIRNAAFIAAARTGWPAALDEVERLSARVTELEAACHQGMHNALVDARAYNKVADERDALRSQLAAALAAKDEACRIALILHDVADPDRDMSDEEISGYRGRGKDRIHQLAAIGRASGEE